MTTFISKRLENNCTFIWTLSIFVSNLAVRQVSCFLQPLLCVNIDRDLMRKPLLFAYLQSLTCIRAFVKEAFGCTRQNPGNPFWDGPWSRVIHFQEEVQVLIACSDRDNRFYRVSSGRWSVFVEMLARLVARGCAEGFVFSSSLSSERERKRRKKGHKSDPLI